MAVLGVNDVELGRRLGVSRQAAHARRTGRTAMTVADMLDVAKALDIDPALFLGSPSDAVRWLAEHRREQLDALEPPGVRHGGDGRGRSLSQKNGLLSLARQHNAWSYSIGVSATAA